MSSENYRIANQNAIYYLTYTVIDWIDVFTRINYRTVIVDSLTFCQKNKGLNLYAWCLMINHIYLICRVVQPLKISNFIRDSKQFIAKRIF